MMSVTSALYDAHINIRAVATFDTPEFGILRLIVDKPVEAKESLLQKGFVTRLSYVTGAELKDEKGNLNEMLRILAGGGINVDYIYSFVIRSGTAPVMIFHTDDNKKTQELLTDAGLRLIAEEDL